MLRVLRITLLWLVALSVPVQGFAAVTMGGCGPGHHGELAPSQNVVGDELAQDTNAFLPTAMAGEAESHSDDSAAPHDHVNSVKAHGGVLELVKGNCSPCAACCVVAGPPAASIRFETVPPVGFIVQSIHSGISLFLTDGLERPPRVSLA